MCGVVALALLACTTRQASQVELEARRERSPGASEAAPPRVAVHGCDLLVEPGARRCLLGEHRRVKLWIPGPRPHELKLRFDGAPIEADELTQLAAAEGTLLQLELAGDHGLLELRADARAAWSLRVAPHSSAYRELEARVLERVVAGELEQAHELLDAGAAQLDADEAAHTRCLAAQLAYGSPRLFAILDALRDSPARACLGTAALIAAHVQIYEQPDLNAAQRSVATAVEVGAEVLAIHVNALFHQADLDLLVGRVDESIDAFDRVIRLAPMIDEPDLVRSAQVMKAIALARLGRFAEVDALIAALEAALDDADERDSVVLDIRYNMAWTSLLRREDDPSVADPSDTLERLLDIYRGRGDARSSARTQLHLALAAEQGGELEAAEQWLEQVDRSALAPFELVWLELVGARVALARRQLGRAGELLDRATTFAELSEDLEMKWLLTVARARLARAKDDPPAALRAYRHADTLADQLALSVPGTAGRSMLVTTHGRADAEQVELLLELDRRAARARTNDDESVEHVERALCVAAGSRARHLRALWARLRPPLSAADQVTYQDLLSRYEARRQSIDAALEQAWSLSAEQLEQLRERLQGEGEQADALLGLATAVLERQAPTWTCARVLPRSPTRAVLTMMRAVDGRRWWFMLARAGQRARVVELAVDASTTPEALASEALARFSSALAGVEVLSVIPVGAFVGVDFQRLAFAQPELARLELRASLGLGRVDARELESASPPRSAIVVAGATDLAAVSEEAASVGEQLRGHGWRVSSTWSPTSEQPTLLHYSGHGHHSGLAGWRSYIEVPGVGRLSAAQIVAGQRAPNYVVLGACSAGSSNPEIIDGGMNLAAAFLLAGAELVIAPSGPVDDEIALMLARELYRELDSSKLDALAHALVEQQRAEFIGEHGNEDGARVPAARSRFRWRVWEP